jgi:hypothetical protein
MSTRHISFGGSTVAVTCEGLEAAELSDFIFARMTTATHGPPHQHFRLSADESGKLWQLFQADTRLLRNPSLPVVAEALLGHVGHHLADRSQGGLLFHAAAVAWQGRGMLLPGQIAAGKSTLAAWLLSQGFDYLTDEMAYLPEGAIQFQAFTRPLNIKRGAWRVIKPLLSPGDKDKVWQTPGVNLVSPEWLGAHQVLRKAPLGLILFPRYRPDAPMNWRQLTKAQAGLRLMECLVNARNLPDHGFAEVTRMAKMVPAYSLEYSHFDQLISLPDQLREELIS